MQTQEHQFAALDQQHTPRPSSDASKVRIISKTHDPYEGLRGHAYIRARNLNQPIKRVQTSAHDVLIVQLEGLV